MPDLQTAAEQLLDQLPKPARKPIPNYSHLSRAEEALILKLADDGLTQVEIAKRLECSQPTVSRVIHDFSDTTSLAKKKAHNLALKAVQKLEISMDQAAEQGKSGPMDSILKMSGLLGQDVSGGVTVIVGGDITDVSFACSTVIDTPVIHSLTEATESDK